MPSELLDIGSARSQTHPSWSASALRCCWPALVLVADGMVALLVLLLRCSVYGMHRLGLSHGAIDAQHATFGMHMGMQRQNMPNGTKCDAISAQKYTFAKRYAAGLLLVQDALHMLMHGCAAAAFAETRVFFCARKKSDAIPQAGGG